MWREVRAMKGGVSFISKNLQGKTRKSMLFIIGVSVAKVEVVRDLAGGLGSELKKWKLFVICR